MFKKFRPVTLLHGGYLSKKQCDMSEELFRL